ncbi:MAG: hypothetical protein JEZ02_06510 [Desulfatibacillum sp.]|nr:hypothetical protein [Desulfatibacillum sp.]
MELPSSMFNVVNTYTKASQAPGLNAESSRRIGAPHNRPKLYRSEIIRFLKIHFSY